MSDDRFQNIANNIKPPTYIYRHLCDMNRTNQCYINQRIQPTRFQPTQKALLAGDEGGFAPKLLF